jgi:two-component system, NarL family, response regulator NreC
VAIRILLCDDHSVIRTGLRALLKVDPELEVVGEAGDGKEAQRLVETLRPDVLLLDIGLPGEDGIEVAKKLKASHPELIVLFLTMHEDDSLLHEALRAGGSGYVIKRAADSEIIDAIHAVHRGDMYVHPAMTRALLRRTATPTPSREAPTGVAGEALTRREIDVLRLVVRGHTNRQVAEVLGVSIRTVEGHRANLLGKLGVSSRVELVTYAEEHGLL